MSGIIDAKSVDLSRFMANKDRKLLIYHGWSDPIIQAEPTLDYYRELVDRTFKGDVDAARKQVRLFMLPGVGHCGGGNGPANWGDQLAPLVDWVENGRAPDSLVATHRTAGSIDNERRIAPTRSVRSIRARRVSRTTAATGQPRISPVGDPAP